MNIVNAKQAALHMGTLSRTSEISVTLLSHLTHPYEQ